MKPGAPDAPPKKPHPPVTTTCSWVAADMMVVVEFELRCGQLARTTMTITWYPCCQAQQHARLSSRPTRGTRAMSSTSPLAAHHRSRQLDGHLQVDVGIHTTGSSGVVWRHK